MKSGASAIASPLAGIHGVALNHRRETVSMGGTLSEVMVLPGRTATPSLFVRLASALGFKREPVEVGRKGGAVSAVDPVPASRPAVPSPSLSVSRPLSLMEKTRGWEAWRERGDDDSTSILHVNGCCDLPPGSLSGRVVLQEAVASPQNEQWGGSWSGTNASPVLVLERVVVPPPFGETTPIKEEAVHVEMSFRKKEKFAALDLLPEPERIYRIQAPRYTHVTILPDGLTLPIQEI